MAVHKWNFASQVVNNPVVDHVEPNGATLYHYASIPSTYDSAVRTNAGPVSIRVDKANTGYTNSGSLWYVYNASGDIYNGASYYIRAYYKIGMGAIYWSAGGGPHLLSNSYNIVEGLHVYWNSSNFVFAYNRGGVNVYPQIIAPSNEWFRVEAFVRTGNSTTDIRIFTGSNVDGVSPSSTFTSGTGTMTKYGSGASYPGACLPSNALYQSTGYLFLYDDVAVADGTYGWIGPELSTAVKRGYGIVRV
jgi:hypothetical protein